MGKFTEKTKEKKVMLMLNNLKRIYDLTKDDYVSITLKELRAEFGMSTQSFKILQNNFLDVKKGIAAKGIPNQSKWKSIKPNINMARKFYEECYKSHLKIKQNKKIELNPNLFTQQEEKNSTHKEEDKKQIRLDNIEPYKYNKGQSGNKKGRPKKVENKEIERKEFSLFWGLIKIKY